MDINIWTSTKVIELGSCAFRQWKAKHSHCQFLHGYQLKAKIWCRGKHLDDKNWIVDFASFKRIKSLLQEHFDHKVCVAKDDPELPFLKQAEERGILKLSIMDSVGIEKTAEFVYHVCNQHIQEQSEGRCWVDKVEVWEHPENSATFEILNEDIFSENDLKNEAESVYNCIEW